ncbi:MAG: phage minor capsid protein, partial [Oscillospiraceae bacterium]
MLTPEQLRSLPRGLTDTYSELSEFILRDIARRIAEAAKITETAEYQMYRAKAIGMSTDEITAKIAEINGVSEKEINELIHSAAEQSDEFDRKMLGESVWSGTPLEENAQLQKLMAAEIKQTHNACWNYTQSLG